MAISMTAADLSASAKPWEIQIKTVKVIFEEFYDQGDKERASGREPIPMMDRNKPNEQPASQVGFLSQICIPCYSMLYKILPHTKPMYAMATINLDSWKYRADKVLNKSITIHGASLGNSHDVSKETSLRDDQLDLESNCCLKDINKLKIYNAEVEVIKQETGQEIVIKNDTITWNEDEDEDVQREEEILKSGILKDIDGVTWIDEEGVVYSQKALRAIVKSKTNREVN